MKRKKMGALVAGLAVVAFVAAGCGGTAASEHSAAGRSTSTKPSSVSKNQKALSKKPSRQDGYALMAVVGGLYGVFESEAPLFSCERATAEAGACDVAHAETLRRLAVSTYREGTHQAAAIESPCLRSVATTYNRSLRPLVGYAKALERGDGVSADAALDAQERVFADAIDQAAACGYVARGQSAGLEFQLSFRHVEHAVVGIDRCRTRPCFARKGREITGAAKAALRRVVPLVPLESRFGYACLRSTATKDVELIRVIERFGLATERLDVDKMQTLYSRMTRLYGQVAKQGRACVERMVVG